MVLSLGSLALVIALVGQEPAQAPPPPDPMKPAPGAKAESLYVAGRKELNRGSFAKAAFLFSAARDENPSRQAAAKIAYWETYAIYRIRTLTSLREAKKLALVHRRRFPKGAYAREAEQLEAQITAELAKRGDSAAMVELRKRAIRLASGSRRPRPAREEVNRPPKTLPSRCVVGSDSGNVLSLQALASIDSASTVPLLARLFSDPTPSTACLRQQAVYLLHRYGGPESHAMLLKIAVTDPDPAVRRQAVAWVGRERDHRTTEALAGLLKRRNDPSVHQEALTALARQRAEAADRVLREYAITARHPRHLREQAIFALAENPARNGAFLERAYGITRDPKLKEFLLYVIGRGPEGSSYLARVALDSSEPLEQRSKAVGLICKAPSVSAAQLVVLYDKISTRDARSQLVVALADRREPLAVEKLEAIAMSDGDQTLRRKASIELRKLRRRQSDTSRMTREPDSVNTP